MEKESWRRITTRVWFPCNLHLMPAVGQCWKQDPDLTISLCFYGWQLPQQFLLSLLQSECNVFFTLKGMNTAPHWGGSENRIIPPDLWEVRKLLTYVKQCIWAQKSCHWAITVLTQEVKLSISSQFYGKMSTQWMKFNEDRLDLQPLSGVTMPQTHSFLWNNFFFNIECNEEQKEEQMITAR